MDKGNAINIVRDLSTELSKLEPSELITLYEIDVSDIKTDLLLGKTTQIADDVFRFHNMNNLKGVTLYFNSIAYFSFPMQVDGFEMSSAGNLPTPTLTITAAEGMDEPLSMMKKAFLHLDNLIGAKVSRIRTFAKYLNKSANDGIDDVGYAEQGLAELPRDVFFIERKSLEDKSSVQFELSSMIDLQNLSLPARMVLAARCPFTYRGEGCLYEYGAFGGTDCGEPACPSGPTYGEDLLKIFGTTDFLPDFAPPVADANDKPIKEALEEQWGTSPYDPVVLGRVIVGAFKNEYEKTETYTKGDVVYLKKDGIRYYFVCRGDLINGSSTVDAYRPPPNTRIWLADQCSKTLEGCKLRWGTNGHAKKCDEGVGEDECPQQKPANEFLMFGGFPGTNTRVTTN